MEPWSLGNPYPEDQRAWFPSTFVPSPRPQLAEVSAEISPINEISSTIFESSNSYLANEGRNHEIFSERPVHLDSTMSLLPALQDIVAKYGPL